MSNLQCSRCLLWLVLICAALAGGLPDRASAATLYFEDFENATFGVSGNWRARFSSTAALPATPYLGGIAAGTIGPTGSPSNKYLYAQHQPTANTVHDWFLYSPGYTPSGYAAFSPADFLGGQLQAQWAINSTSAVVNYYFAVEVNGTWYASNDMRTTTNSTQNPVAALDLLSTTWTDIDLTTTGTTSLALGSDMSTFDDLFGADQQITGIGFYIAGMPDSPDNHRTVRIDNITITGSPVPEPGRALLLGFGIIALFARRTRCH